MPDLFKEIVPSILQTKKSPFQQDYEYSDYVPFVVNKALSFHIDCLPYVNEMNRLSHLDKDMQYQYLFHSIRQMKRKFQPWQKTQKHNDLECIKKYFNYSNQKAKECLKLLTEDQIKYIREKTDIGGIKKTQQ